MPACHHTPFRDPLLRRANRASTRKADLPVPIERWGTGEEGGIH